MTYMGIGIIMMTKTTIINLLIAGAFSVPVYANNSTKKFSDHTAKYGYGYNPYYYNYGKGFRFYVAPQWRGYYNYQPRIYRYYLTPYGSGVYEW
jgi:hypothetical protein